MEFMYWIYAAAAVVFIIVSSISFVKQGSVYITVIFGKYARILKPGFNFRVPLIEYVHRKLSLQNRSVELEFQAITCDQANVNFKALILYTVRDEQEDTILKATFKFIDEKSFMQSLIRSIEGSVRAYVGTKRQDEILSLRQEIVEKVREHIEEELNDWGYHLISLQVNDINFDEAIMRSMAQVVATNNMKTAAENEANAQYISKVRLAEAEARAIELKAEAEKNANLLKGKGQALFREEVVKGLAKAKHILEENQVEPQFMLFTMWLESLKHIAEHGHGNILSFDGSQEGFEKSMKQMQLLANQRQQQHEGF